MTEEEKEKIKRVFEKEERHLRWKMIFFIIGEIIELFFYGAVVYLLIKQCS